MSLPGRATIVSQVKDYIEHDDEKYNQKSLLPGTEYDRTNYLKNFDVSTSRDFIDEITYSVPLDKLYKVKDSCSSNESCEYQGVLLQIKDEKLAKDYYQASHLIQVWNKKGTMILQRDFDIEK